MDSVELGRYLAALELECQTWGAVAMRVPGSRDFCEQAWQAWIEAASEAREARAKWQKRASLKARLEQFEAWRIIRY
jgi:hypothetical protein